MARNAKAENIMVEVSPAVRKALEEIRKYEQRKAPDRLVTFREIIAELILDRRSRLPS
jgi:hypothetical protein